MMKNQIANIVTAFRVVCSIVLLLFPLFSLGFYVVYLLCGFSDMIDGVVARKTNSCSSFGAKLDTVADLIFMVAVCCKLLPVVYVAQWIWVWIVIIAAVKLCNIAWGLLRRKTLISVHSALNKVTGVVLFLLPLTIQILELNHSLAIACLIATIAAIDEGYCIRVGREIV